MQTNQHRDDTTPPSGTVDTEQPGRGQAAASEEPRATKGARPGAGVADLAADTVGRLAEVGLTWARHGLGVGRSSLEAAARTLSETAAVLDNLARGLASDAPEESPATGAEASTAGAASEPAAPEEPKAAEEPGR